MASLLDWMKDVTRFAQEVLGLPLPEKPTMLSAARKEWALFAFREEDAEFEQATSVSKAADALMDGIYFRLGRLAEMGVNPELAWHPIQEANMKKTRGKLSKRPGSLGYDAIKPKGWVAPDHTWLDELNTADVENLRRRALAKQQPTAAANTDTFGALKFSATKPPMGLLPVEFLEEVANSYGHGAKKYAPWNYIKGRPWMDYIDAAMRHIVAIANGEVFDAESGKHGFELTHLGCAGAELGMLSVMMRTRPDLNNTRGASK